MFLIQIDTIFIILFFQRLFCSITFIKIFWYFFTEINLFILVHHVFSLNVECKINLLRELRIISKRNVSYCFEQMFTKSPPEIYCPEQYCFSQDRYFGRNHMFCQFFCLSNWTPHMSSRFSIFPQIYCFARSIVQTPTCFANYFVQTIEHLTRKTSSAQKISTHSNLPAISNRDRWISIYSQHWLMVVSKYFFHKNQ